jgi:hypothetical protein
MTRLLLVTSLLVQMPLAMAQAAAPPANAQVSSLQGLFVEERAVGPSSAFFHYYFWADGRYCLGLPYGGLGSEPADFKALSRTQPCGQYKLGDDRLSLQPADGGATQNLSLSKRQGERFELNGHPTFKVPASASNASLEGQYSALIHGSQMNRQSYLFRSNGTYQFESVPMTSSDGSPMTFSGNYKMVGHTLQLSGAPTQKSLTAYVLKPGALMIEGDVFSR